MRNVSVELPLFVCSLSKPDADKSVRIFPRAVDESHGSPNACPLFSSQLVDTLFMTFSIIEY